MAKSQEVGQYTAVSQTPLSADELSDLGQQIWPGFLIYKLFRFFNGRVAALESKVAKLEAQQVRK